LFVLVDENYDRSKSVRIVCCLLASNSGISEQGETNIFSKMECR